jgi:hypothetical protein
VHPTAIGLTPPSALLNATREAPKQKGFAESRTPPLRTKLTKAVRDWTKRAEPAPFLTEMWSLRCCGWRPSGPPADPAGKDWIDLITSEVDNCTGLQEPGAGFGGMDNIECGGGCFWLKRAKVFSLVGANERIHYCSLFSPFLQNLLPQVWQLPQV